MRQRTRVARATPAIFLVLAACGLRAEGSAMEISTLAGFGVDWETAVEGPVHCIGGIGVSDAVVGARAALDCGLPREPSARVDADVALIDLGLLRLGMEHHGWVRAYADHAWEAGVRSGGGVELGPRFLALSGAAGFAWLATYYGAIDQWLKDSFPWARVGLVVRPVKAARFELCIASDSPLALWLRTSFELSGSWRLPSGIRIEGLLAARYSDFFTLTAYLDGFEARVLVLVPVLRGVR